MQYADCSRVWAGRWVGFSACARLHAALRRARWCWSGMHRALDRRSFRAFALALASASLGAVIVLNLRAGPSYGVGVLPPDALHEARERDYFFAIAFALVGVWAGSGAARFGRWLAVKSGMRGVAAAAALALAGAPLVLNWRAADRSTDVRRRSQTVCPVTARSAPRNAVLLVAGDNDTYPCGTPPAGPSSGGATSRCHHSTPAAQGIARELWRRQDYSSHCADAWRGFRGRRLRRSRRHAPSSSTAPSPSRSPSRRSSATR